MQNQNALVLGGSAAAPLIWNGLSPGPYTRKITFGASVATAVVYALTKNRTAGAVAPGTGGAWLLMKLTSDQTGWP